MQISRTAQLALRTVLDLALIGQTRIADVAGRRGIPGAQAGKIVQQLVRGGVVRATRGARGGVQLARAPETITVRDVVEAIEGPTAVARCLVWNDCPCDQPCAVRNALVQMQTTIERVFDSVTVADLATDAGRFEALRTRTGKDDASRNPPASTGGGLA